jgi:hypothetical protein
MRILCLLALLVSVAHADPAITLTGKKLKEYHALYRDRFALAVRRELKRFLAGQLDAESPAVKGALGKGTDGLATFSRDYYKSPFIVIQIAPFLGGGRNVSIIFSDKPDKVFDVWIYCMSSERCEMRGFVQDTEFEVAEIQAVYRNLLSDRRHTL